LDEPTNDLDIVTLNTLEEFLETFPGCLIIVSHDRYFMDRLVDHLFVFEGQGVIKDFPGNYTDFREWEEDNKSIAKTEVKEVKAVLAESKPASDNQKMKASFKEKKEFEEITAKMQGLTQEKEQILEGLNTQTDPQEIVKLSQRLPVIDEALENLELRWLEWSELERIS
jgi:ATP-binding cassette subfamily F protein uup